MPKSSASSAHGFVDRFASVSDAYAGFRPTYPPALFAWLAAAAPGRAWAWDCATGSGQAAGGLAEHFERVIATDASAAQLQRATAHPRVEYRIAPAEDCGIASGAIDLVTVAQAFHWFERDRFFAECVRVLRSHGLLALWTYGPMRVADAAVDAIVQRYYHCIVGAYWPAERALVDAGYAGVALPFPELEVPRFRMAVSWPLERLLGYLGTWTSTIAYRAAEGADPRERIRGDLAAAWGDPASAREVVWPLTVRVGRKPGV